MIVRQVTMTIISRGFTSNSESDLIHAGLRQPLSTLRDQVGPVMRTHVAYKVETSHRTDRYYN